MPRLAPFSTPRGRASSPDAASRPSTPFVPAWLRGYAEREDAPVTPLAESESAWHEQTQATEPAPDDVATIDAFLVGEQASTFAEPTDVPTIEAFLASVEMPSADLAELTTDEPAAPVVAESDLDETGPYTLESSAAEIEALARALADGPKRPTPVQLRAIEDAARFGLDAALVERVGPQPLPEWSDEDFVDIMPAMALPEPTPVVPQGPDPDALADEAASMLEAIAERVRTREIALPLYTPGMGDAAVLAAALAALLASQ
jgi:hypothetical protein